MFAQPVPTELPAIVARVNGQSISRTELELVVRTREARAGKPTSPDRRDEVFRTALDELVGFSLLVEDAKLAGLTVTEAEIDVQLSVLRDQVGGEVALQKALTNLNLTLDRTRQQIRADLLVQKRLTAAVTASVTDEEVASFYEANLAQFTGSEQRRAAHILFRLPPRANAATHAAVRARAETVLKLAREGADFAGLALEHSDDKASVPHGGDLGFFEHGEMHAAFASAAFALDPGGIIDVVETPAGFHIVKLVERRQPEAKPLAEVQGRIRTFLEQRKRTELAKALVEGLKALATIQVLI